MQRLGPIDLQTAVREWAEHEAGGRWAHLNVTAKQVLLVRDPIVREITDPRDVYRARIDPSERGRIRLGTNDRTIATWRVTNDRPRWRGSTPRPEYAFWARIPRVS